MLTREEVMESAGDLDMEILDPASVQVQRLSLSIIAVGVSVCLLLTRRTIEMTSQAMQLVRISCTYSSLCRASW